MEEKLKALKESKLSKEKENLEQHKNLELNHFVTDQTLKSAEALQQVETLTREQNKEAENLLSEALNETGNNEKEKSDLSLDSDDDLRSTELDEENFVKALEASDLFKIVRSLHENTSGIYDFSPIDPNTVISEKLEPVFLDELSPQEKVVYNFCQFILGLITAKCDLRPVTLLVANAIPPMPDNAKNAFHGLFSYDATNRFLYILRPKLAEKNPGNLYVMIAHCAAHIKIGDLSNDYNPYFRAEFYNVLAKISEYIFTARTDPSITLPEDYQANSTKIQELFPQFGNTNFLPQLLKKYFF